MSPVIGITSFKMYIKRPSLDGRCQVGSEMYKPRGYVRGWRHKFGSVGLQMTFKALRSDELIKGESLDYKEKKNASRPEL